MPFSCQERCIRTNRIFLFACENTLQEANNKVIIPYVAIKRCFAQTHTNMYTYVIAIHFRLSSGAYDFMLYLYFNVL